MDGSLDLIKEELVGSTDDDGLRVSNFHALKEHVLPVADSTLLDLGASSQVLRIESLLAIFDVGERDDNLSAGGLGDTAQVKLLDSPDGDHTGLDEVLKGEVVDATRAEHDVGASLNDLPASVLADVHLLLTDLVKLLSVLAENLDTHLETELVEVEVNTGNLAVLEHLRHALGAARGLNGVAVDKDGFLGGHTVSLQDVHVLDWVLGLTLSVGHLDVPHGSDDHVGEEVRLGSEELRAHGGLGSLHDRLFGELVLAHNQLLLNKVDGLFESETVTRHN